MEFKLPDIGEGVHEGEIVRWLVKPGDMVKVDQALVEVMTDKATVEIPTATAGKITALLAKEGDMVKVGQAIAQLEEGGASVSASASKSEVTAQPHAAKAPVIEPSAVVAKTASVASASSASAVREYIADAGTVLASPATRRMARELGVDLTQIAGSGPAGRVMKEDLQKNAGGMALSVSGGALSAMAAHSGSAQRGLAPLATGQMETILPLRGMRRKIAEGMRNSKDTAAHFTYVDECDVSELVRFRGEAKKMAEEKGVKLTYLPFLIKGVIQCLKKYPMFNASLDDAAGQIIQKHYYNIGIAMDTEDGLIVPVVKNCDQKSVLEIARDISALAEKAKNKKLAVDDLKGGTFTITNAGTIGGLFATPIINHPEVAILGFNKIAKRPHIRPSEPDKIIVADMTWFSISVDHRVVDGADAARFINDFMALMANPKRLMLDMI